MDTNLINQLLVALNQPKIVPVSNQNSVVIAQMLVTLLTPLILAMIVWFQKQASSAAEKTAQVVQKIETNVNSERTKMIERLEAITGAFTDVSKKLAVLEERRDVEQRTKEAASVVADAVTLKKEQMAQAVAEVRKQDSKPASSS